MLVAANPLIEIRPGLMIWTIICFLISLYVLKRFAFGPIQKGIDERRDRIRQSIEEADNARAEAHRMLEEHKALIASAKSDAEEIRAEARKVADSQTERMKAETEIERERRLEETRQQIQAETRRSLEQIRREVADLTLIAATKVTQGALDETAHRKLIDNAIAELDFSALEGSPN